MQKESELKRIVKNFIVADTPQIELADELGASVSINACKDRLVKHAAGIRSSEYDR